MLEDTHELVLSDSSEEPLRDAWRAAAAEARGAYVAWTLEPGALRHAAYLAAEDRADAALAALTSNASVPAECPHAPRRLAA